MLDARGILVGHKTVRQWALKFGQSSVNRICPVLSLSQ
jgi:transposase-like protein